MHPNLDTRLFYAKQSLIGLSVGDAIGESFFGKQDEILLRIHERRILNEPMFFTDDTIMSIAVYKCLEKFGEINQDFLAALFAHNYQKDDNRGYGGTAHGILRSIHEGNDWRTVAKNVFDGMGSMGNGAAMRAGIIGAYFFEDLTKVKAQAILSAQPTHAHIEAIVGAMAVAVAVALAIQYQATTITPNTYIGKIYELLPDSDTKSKIGKSLSIPIDYHIKTVVSILGNGINLTAPDTVPFAIWCAAHHLKDYEEGIWKAISALGDRDTIGAIVGSILAIGKDVANIPKDWIALVESPEKSIFWQS
jgi:ADP-ribosylglycohydrolase